MTSYKLSLQVLRIYLIRHRKNLYHQYLSVILLLQRRTKQRLIFLLCQTVLNIFVVALFADIETLALQICTTGKLTIRLNTGNDRINTTCLISRFRQWLQKRIQRILRQSLGLIRQKCASFFTSRTYFFTVFNFTLESIRYDWNCLISDEVSECVIIHIMSLFYRIVGKILFFLLPAALSLCSIFWYHCSHFFCPIRKGYS